MRALVLISSLATGGAERITVSFLCRLARMGIPALVCTVTARHDGPLATELSEAGVIRHDLGARRLADPLALLRLLRLLRRERIDLVHAHGQDASILAGAARRLSRVPLIITRHVLEEPAQDWRERLRAKLALASIRRADAVVAVSSAAADRLAELARLPRSAFRVIPNGIDLERFRGNGTDLHQTALRRTLGLSRDTRLVLLPAVLREGKGHDVLLDAVPALKKRVPSVHVLFVGGGEREAALRSLAQPYREMIRFLGPRNDIPELMAACDLVVLPSLTEALPTVLMEAAAAGRPVVATRVGGAVEIVEEGRTGLLVTPGDPVALAEAMVNLLINCDLAHAFGEAARRLAQERFSLDLQIRFTMALWDDVVAGRRR